MKRLVILLFSAVYFCFAALSRLLRRYLAQQRSGACIVLYYHAVRPEHRHLFARQMDTLLRVATPVRADRQEPLAPGVRSAAVTFDDGYRSVVENALPELEKRGIPCTMFIVTEALGKYPAWLEIPADPVSPEVAMSVDQLRSLRPELVTVGSHTLTHPRLPSLAEDRARCELLESRTKLAELLNRPVNLFSFPYGAFNDSVIQLSRDAGYERVFTTLPTPAFSHPDEFVTGRVSVEPTDWPLEFRLKLLGAYCWLPRAFALKRRILSAPVLRSLARVSSRAGVAGQVANPS
jgi:peptidoglycan/xylan/chitin deacetylase (PgdA/CDA1 family)